MIALFALYYLLGLIKLNISINFFSLLNILLS